MDIREEYERHEAELESQLRSLTEENERWKARAERAEAQEKLAWEKFDKYGWETSYGEMATRLREAEQRAARYEKLLQEWVAPYRRDLESRRITGTEFARRVVEALSPINPPFAEESGTGLIGPGPIVVKGRKPSEATPSKFTSIDPPLAQEERQ